MNLITRTPRLLLREFLPADAEQLFLLNNDPQVLRFTGDRPFPSVEAAASFLEDYPDYRNHGFGRWGVVEQSSGDFLGWCGLKRHDAGMVDLGFRFFRRYWGMGYATESGRASLQYGFDEAKLPEIIGRAATHNLTSIRVLEKLGMTYWTTTAVAGLGQSRQYRITAADYYDR